MKITIYPIPLGLATSYVIQGEGAILIDGGGPNQLRKLKRAVEKASIRPEEIQLIVLTHGHWDHVGSAKDIKAWTGARVMMHQKDLHYLDDVHPSLPPYFTRWSTIINAPITLYVKFIRIPAVKVDLIVEDAGLSLLEFGIPGQVIYTPGHTWGSISVLLENGDAFVGDLAVNGMPLRLGPGPAILGDDFPTVKESIHRLLVMGAKRIHPAHGKPFRVEQMH